MPYGRGEEASNQLYRVLLAACSSISLFCSVPCADAAKGMYCVMCLDVNLMLLLQLGWEVRCESMDQVRKLARAVDSGKGCAECFSDLSSFQDVNDQEEFVRYLNQARPWHGSICQASTRATHRWLCQCRSRSWSDGASRCRCFVCRF